VVLTIAVGAVLGVLVSISSVGAGAIGVTAKRRSCNRLAENKCDRTASVLKILSNSGFTGRKKAQLTAILAAR